MKAWISRWGPAVLVMMLIFIASAMPASDLPDFGVIDTFAKKGGHMFGYALLAAAFFHALNGGRKLTGLQLVLSVCLAVMYAAGDEFHQSFTPGRSPSPVDVAIDAFGSLAGLAVWCRIRKRFPGIDRTAGSIKPEQPTPDC